MKAVIIIPTYNEAENIGKLIEHLQEVFKKIKNWQMEILVVDDSSPDGTGNVVKEKSKTYKGVHLFTNKEKKGLGAAYIKGMKYAMEKIKADVVFEFDADGSHKPEYLPGMLRELEGKADVVVGSRYVPGGSMPEDWGLNRKIVSYLGNLIARVVLLTPFYHDMTSGFRGTKTSFLAKAELNNLLSKQYAYKIHLFYALHKLGAKIIEYPIEFVDRRKGKSKFPKNNVIDSLRVVFTLRLQESEKFLKVCFVGLIGAVVQFSVFNALRLSVSPVLANVFGIELAIISNFIVNNFWTFKEEKIELNNFFKLIWKFLQFNLVSLGSIIIQAVVMKIGVSILGRSLIYENALVMLGILIGLIWNYTMYTKLIWKKKN